jgi:hypothetical protein
MLCVRGQSSNTGKSHTIERGALCQQLRELMNL